MLAVLRGLVAALVLPLACAAVGATELTAFVAVAFRNAMEPLVGEFERASSRKVKVVYATAGALRQKLLAGEAADVVVLPRAFFDPLLAEGKIAAGSQVPIAQAMVAIATKAGAPKPDISTAEALRTALLAARGVAYSDPARGGQVGIHAHSVIQRLGIAEPLKTRTRLTDIGPPFYDLLATGDVELGFTTAMAIADDPRLQLVGSLPADLQDPGNFLFLAGIPANAAEAAAGRALLQHLASQTSARVIKAKGMEPRTAP